MCAQYLSRVPLFVTLWTVACQAPLSVELFRQEYWSGLPFPSPGDFPDQGTEPASLASPASPSRFLPPCHLGRSISYTPVQNKKSKKKNKKQKTQLHCGTDNSFKVKHGDCTVHLHPQMSQRFKVFWAKRFLGSKICLVKLKGDTHTQTPLLS